MSAGDAPSQPQLRRAISTAYYAMFHHLAKLCADLIVGEDEADRSQPAWRQAYRAVEHLKTKDACKNKEMMRKFPDEIADYANYFATIQVKRHEADYNPDAQFTQTEVVDDIESVDAVLNTFEGVALKDKRAFCVFVLFKDREAEKRRAERIAEKAEQKDAARKAVRDGNSEHRK